MKGSGGYAETKQKLFNFLIIRMMTWTNCIELLAKTSWSDCWFSLQTTWMQWYISTTGSLIKLMVGSL